MYKKIFNLEAYVGIESSSEDLDAELKEMRLTKQNLEKMTLETQEVQITFLKKEIF